MFKILSQVPPQLHNLRSVSKSRFGFWLKLGICGQGQTFYQGHWRNMDWLQLLWYPVSPTADFILWLMLCFTVWIWCPWEWLAVEFPLSFQLCPQDFFLGYMVRKIRAISACSGTSTSCLLLLWSTCILPLRKWNGNKGWEIHLLLA